MNEFDGTGGGMRCPACGHRSLCRMSGVIKKWTCYRCGRHWRETWDVVVAAVRTALVGGETPVVECTPTGARERIL